MNSLLNWTKLFLTESSILKDLPKIDFPAKYSNEFFDFDI